MIGKMWEVDWDREMGSERVGETTGSMTHNNKNNEAIEVNYCESPRRTGGRERLKAATNMHRVVGFIFPSQMTPAIMVHYNFFCFFVDHEIEFHRLQFEA